MTYRLLSQRVRSMFCACYGCLFSLFIEVLAACHCCLICKGVTTKEWVSHHRLSLHGVYLILRFAMRLFMAVPAAEVTHTLSCVVVV